MLSVPLSAFKQTSTPQQSLGMLDIHHTFSTDELREKMETLFNISVFTPGNFYWSGFLMHCEMMALQNNTDSKISKALVSDLSKIII